MDLRNNQITVGELLDYPPAKAVLLRRFGSWLSYPVVVQSRSLPLSQVMQRASVILSPRVIQDTLEELKKI